MSCPKLAAVLLVTLGCATRQAQAPAAPSLPSSPPSPGAASEAAPAPPASQPTGAQTPDERRETLDGKLDKSLSEFDALLLREQERIAAEKQKTAAAEGESGSGGATGESGGTGENAGGDKGLGTAGSRGGARGGGGGSGRQGGEDRTTGGSTSTPRGTDGAPVTAPPEGAPQASGDPDRIPPDVGDGRDDDVVARQLREAAIKENDPELREKLWQEYREYKQSTAKKRPEAGA